MVLLHNAIQYLLYFRTRLLFEMGKKKTRKFVARKCEACGVYIGATASVCRCGHVFGSASATTPASPTQLAPNTSVGSYADAVGSEQPVVESQSGWRYPISAPIPISALISIRLLEKCCSNFVILCMSIRRNTLKYISTVFSYNSCS